MACRVALSSFAASVSALAPGALGSGGGTSSRLSGASTPVAANNTRGAGAGAGAGGGASAGQSNPPKQKLSPGPSLASRIDQKLANLNLDEY